MPKCNGRTSGAHCWHTYMPAFKNSPTAIVGPSLCCFCAPRWLQYTIIVPHTLSAEDATTLQMQHGPLIVIQIAQKPASTIAVARGVDPRIKQ